MPTTPAPVPRLFSFIAGTTGPWHMESTTAITGQPLAAAPCIDVVAGTPALPVGASWLLRGITSNERYVERTEKTTLVSMQEGLGRAQATCAALIPIRKTAAWWALTQDERRQIFEAQSHHIQIGLKYLPAVARRLHHCRDLGPDEPFDFVTWFEYASADQPLFEELLHALRASPEWAYIDREVDIRLRLAAG
ncbi:MAG: chlorite dismutase family protein [Burkholderiaceae bacterium]